MELKRLKAIHDKVLRGGFCAIWVAAILIAFYELLYAVTYDVGDPAQKHFIIRAVVCLLVLIAAALIHTHLMETK